MFPTRNFFPKARLTPTQKISTFPTKEMSEMAPSVRNGSRNPANNVMLPCQSPTGMAEKSAPLP